MQDTDKIIEKIQNLLSLAEDGGDDEESQTALLMAQKLMLKHKIQQDEIKPNSGQEIVTKSLSIYKRLFWWEKMLATVVASNFRVMMYVQSNKFPHQSSRLSKLVFMGLTEDVDFALDVYHLAETAMKHHAKNHLQTFNDKTLFSAAETRKAYYRGFIDGLDAKYEAQKDALIKESSQYELVIQVPDSVTKAFYDKVSPKKIRLDLPDVDYFNDAYDSGYHKGKQMNFSSHYLE